MIPNLSYGLLPYEADFVVISKAGYLTEVEIKRSWQDFKADFKKDHKHDAEQVYYFYYCVPESIVDKVVDFLKAQYGSGWCPALLKFTEKGCVSRVSVKDETTGRYGLSARSITLVITANYFWRNNSQSQDWDNSDIGHY